MEFFLDLCVRFKQQNQPLEVIPLLFRQARKVIFAVVVVQPERTDDVFHRDILARMKYSEDFVIKSKGRHCPVDIAIDGIYQVVPALAVNYAGNGTRFETVSGWLCFPACSFVAFADPGVHVLTQGKLGWIAGIGHTARHIQFP